MCTVRLRYKNKNAKCRFCVVPGEGPALIGMPDIKLLNILKIICEVIDDRHESKKINFQTVEASNGPTCRINRAQQNKTGKVHADDLM